MEDNHFCNNCGKQGHMFHQCKTPITSFGVIAFRFNRNKKTEKSPYGRYEYLMIRRKDTLGYIDFMRGKYSLSNPSYILNMMKQMTVDEKLKILEHSFDELWADLWGCEIATNQYKNEELVSKEKFNHLNKGIVIKNQVISLQSLIDESAKYYTWVEPEWGFPKGRRNYKEKDYECALREFSEETGYSPLTLKNVHNILPFEEIFMGSNYKTYKHKYYLMYMPDILPLSSDYEKAEVSGISWKTYDECCDSIRVYNLEKIHIITNIEACLMKHKMYYS